MPNARIESSSAIVPVTLLRQYIAGSATDSPTSDLAAKCTTASIAQSPRTVSRPDTGNSWNTAPGGTASA